MSGNEGALRRLLARHSDKLRFGAVGALNTVLDFSLLFAFVGLGVNQYVANYLSTSCAIVFSYFMNRRFTFRSEGSKRREVIPFLLVTLAGLWALQPFVIWLMTIGMRPFAAEEYVVLFVAKLVATVASLVWNYLMYRWVVFTPRQQG